MDQFSAHLDRGWDLIHRGDLAGALLSAEKSLEIDAQSPEAYNLMGYVRAAQGDAEEALEHYRQAIALDESFVEAMLNAAEVLIHPIHDFDGARGLVREALDFAEDDDEIADALLISFDAHMHEGDRAGAGKVAARLPDGPFNSPRLDFLIGRAHFEVGAVERAESFLQRALTNDGENPDLFYYLAMLHESRDDTEQATVAFLRARRLDLLEPDPPWALSAEHFEQQVQRALSELPKPFSDAIEGALVVVSDLPGVELVADGIDPRTALVLDAMSEPNAEPKVGRVFVYKRNVERAIDDPLELAGEIAQLLASELAAAYPALEAKLSEQAKLSEKHAQPGNDDATPLATEAAHKN